jgi:hypothetical protein
VLEFVCINALRRNMLSRLPNCNILLFLTTRILLFTAIIMVGINLYFMKFVPYHYYAVHAVNRNIPYITVLILAPVTLLTVIWAYFYRRRMTFCKECRIKYGSVQERGFIGEVFTVETIYQMRMLMGGTALIIVYTWLYYYFYYSNVNFNPSDKFYFIWVPVILYLLSVVYMAMRYVRIYEFYKANIVGDALSTVSSTCVRYVLLHDSSVFIGEDESETNLSGRQQFDTTAMLTVPYRKSISEIDARKMFEQVSGIKNGYTLKLMYVNTNDVTSYNIFHFLCIVDDERITDGSKLSGVWLGQRELEHMFREGALSPVLSSAMHRIYTILAAYKTYSAEGYRLYDIKHYKPSVRLRELATTNVDFNDTDWLVVAEENEDKPLFRLRKFWKKYVSGTQS